MSTSIVAASGTFEIGGITSVNRLGYGSMQLTGPGVWGDPKDPDEAVAVLRRAVELGVNLIDTADAYGPFVAEELIRDALHPYPSDLVIATKAGFTRPGPGVWKPVGRPEYLRQQVELSLRHLRLERIELLQLHRIDPKVPLAEQVGELKALQDEGKIHHIGLSEVNIEQLVEAQRTATIVTVQNLFNLADQRSVDVLTECTERGIAFVPFCPLGWPKAQHDAIRTDPVVNRIAASHGATSAQVALAWLQAIAENMLLIPGTRSRDHLTENLAAGSLSLRDDDIASLNEASITIP